MVLREDDKGVSIKIVLRRSVVIAVIVVDVVEKGA